MLRTTIVVCALAASAAQASSENAETLSERSQAAARATLDRAVNAIGGAEALRAIEVVRLRLEGETWPRLQMPTPEPPFDGGTLRETLLLDLKGSRLLLEQHGNGAGFENHDTIVIKSGQGANYNHRARTVTPIPAAQSSQQQFIQYYRRLPNLLLRQALERTNTLRSLGQETFEGKAHDVFTFVMADTQQVAVYVDSASGLVSKYELIFVDPLTGEDATEVLFGDYTNAGKLRVPQTWLNRQAGDTAARYRVQVEINPAVNDQSFEVAAAGYAQVDPVPEVLEEQVEKLAEGVFVINNIAAQNYNTLAIEFKDYVVAVEAPGSSDGADRVIERIKQAIPGKPIRYVVVTHHHSDHIGGLRSFIAEGATVVTTQENRKVVEMMAKAPQNDRLAKNPRAPQFMLIEKGKRVLSDGSRRVELIDVGPNPHARQMMIAYLPRERIVFQGDLLFLPQNDAPLGPPQAGTSSFAKRMKELNLKVDRIASVHGRTATMEEFVRANQDDQGS